MTLWIAPRSARGPGASYPQAVHAPRADDPAACEEIDGSAVGLPEGPARLDVRYGTLNETVETAAAAHDPRPIEVRLKGR